MFVDGDDELNDGDISNDATLEAVFLDTIVSIPEKLFQLTIYLMKN